MSDKKEILDYLRNRQKASEIEAKVNGINSWVLLGAISIIIWQLLEQLIAGNYTEIYARTCLASSALFLLTSLSLGYHSSVEDLRFSDVNLSEIQMPIILLIIGMWYSIPSLIIYKYYGIDNFSVFYIGIYGLLSILIAVAGIASRLFKKEFSPTSEKFPKPIFEPSSRTNFSINMLLSFGCMFTLYQQAIFFSNVPFAPIAVIKSAFLIFALYLLVLVLLHRQRDKSSINWTYELETNIVVGAITSEAALRKIENRALGHKLEDVINKFLDHLDEKISTFEKSMTLCSQRLPEISNIPKEYKAERATKLSEITNDVDKQLTVIETDFAQFSDYLLKLQTKIPVESRLSSITEQLFNQKNIYKDKISTLKNRIETIKRDYN